MTHMVSIMPERYEKLSDVGGTELAATDSKEKQTSISDFMSESGKRTGCMCRCLPKRYLTIIMVFVGLLSLHAMRVNVSVTVVTILGQDPYAKVQANQIPEVRWNSQMVGFLHSIFYVGYLLTQIPGGLLVTKGGFAGHRIFGCSILVSSCLNLVLPVAIDDVGFALACSIRFLQGLTEGLTFPGLYAILRHWTTPGETGRLGGFAITGVYSGAILGYPVAGLLTHYVNWQCVYYGNGVFGILWFVIWFLFSYEKPDVHPYITTEELEHFQSKNAADTISHQNEKVPWKRIFSSLPLMATAVSHFARSWVFYMLLTNQPTYFDVFGFSVAQNGVLSSIPHILMVIFSACSGPIADLLMSRPSLSVTSVRKIMNTTGFGVECICMAALGFVKDGTAAVVLLSIASGFSGLCVSGWQINHLDLAPRYSSILISITSMFGVTAGISNPLIVGVITPKQTIAEWNVVFIIVACVLFTAAVVFLIFGSGERQEWAEPQGGKNEMLITSDPFEDRPYGTFQQQYKFTEDSAEHETDLSAITEESVGTESNEGTDDIK